ncbi:MAG TPA: type II toxin-antitoxin system RelE/ParE family toxin [Acidobacteriota bacterium]|nr:type II toxin-antitoxin system RelE/ParE family toxin [Acidobacteriota bacterium]
MYSIELTPQAARQLKKLASDTRAQLARAIDRLGSDPRPRGVKKLKGKDIENCYRLRVGDFRIIYQVRNGDELVILIVRIGDRKEVYKDQKRLVRLLKRLRSGSS